MDGINNVTLIGNLGRDAELRYTPGGVAVATFNLAVSESWRDKGGQKQERTEWVRVVLWAKAAEALTEYLQKGKQVYINGRLQTRKWTDKDGVEKFTTEIRADRVLLLGGGPRRDNGTGSDRHVPDEHVGTDADPTFAGEPDTDIPF